MSQLETENSVLKSNLQSVQSAVSILKQPEETEKKADIKPVIEESKTVTK
jgi:hypothetical protein